ncbi:MAG: ligase-associated DNA damage response exonuclease [Planctomycetota bacterium]|nr:ligase-associated DNA damage response exonuclease [Planctomycetota bacterium]
MKSEPLVTLTPSGLFCAAGGFHIDPWRPVERAIITHAHADHARTGSANYLAADRCENVLRTRLGEIRLQTLPYGEEIGLGSTRISLHPAGHVLGSAQVRIEARGEVWVVSGDYKVAPDPTCEAFEAVHCETFVTESTFGLPIYRWKEPREIASDIDAWWGENAERGRTSVLFGYAFGKAQRILAHVNAAIGPIFCHGAVESLNSAYRASGVALPPTKSAAEATPVELARALIVAPPAAQSTPWMRRFGDYSDAFASGWMHLRGTRRRRGVDRGIVLSDHADWPGLIGAITATGASSVYVTHGYAAPLARYLSERGLETHTFETEFEGESGGDVSGVVTDLVDVGTVGVATPS